MKYKELKTKILIETNSDSKYRQRKGGCSKNKNVVVHRS